MSTTEIPSKTIVVAATYRTGLNVATEAGVKFTEIWKVVTEPSSLHGLILREGDRVLLAEVVPTRVWETLSTELGRQGLEIAPAGVLVKTR